MARLAKEPNRSDKQRSADVIECLRQIDRRLLWLSSWIIHNANHIRPNNDGLKVGGHQASCASMTTLMTALYFHELRSNDRVAVKPHASPVLHAADYLLGTQDLEQLKRFRAFGGAQSYPSRTKDKNRVDFSTGSVGLGVAITAFASLVQEYLIAHQQLPTDKRGRMIALLGDAELDEGNIYEALIESYKHQITNTWWIVDYNRQSLDATTHDRMFTRFDDIFASAGWDVVTLKYGLRQREAFEKKGGPALQEWIETCPNALYSALTFQGGKAWRERLSKDIGRKAHVRKLLEQYDDDQLALLMTELGGHCIESILDALSSADGDRPRLIIAYTIKGNRLPFQGHKDNHSGLMTDAQITTLRDSHGIQEGQEWDRWAGIEEAQLESVRSYVESVPMAQKFNWKKSAPLIEVPQKFPTVSGAQISTQAAFGKILNDLARDSSELARQIVTTSPDVSVSTNLGGFVNQRGLFSTTDVADVFKESNIASMQKWASSKSGQHIELGIAENNLFLLLGALGLSADLFGTRLLPVGTLYDPFIARGLDALNYACYQDARFLLVATPSGITLGPEGGAHQSISTPLIGAGQPNLTYFEPAFADELSITLRWAFEHMQKDAGGSVYLRLSTRSIDQVSRPESDAWEADMLQGAYWIHPPSGSDAELAIIFTGPVAPEAIRAYDELKDEIPSLGLMNVTSPDVLKRDWYVARQSRWVEQTRPKGCHIEKLLSPLSKNAGLVTVLDGAADSLSWIGSVAGHKVVPLGVGSFGQVGSIQDLYSHYRLDTTAIIDSCVEHFIRD